ncbi:MAG: hypothetical protein MUO39_15415 [Steroidobacteraceae bacterium]|nr:hypothetical protein [Steroidobacteraceae bacterium]
MTTSSARGITRSRVALLALMALTAIGVAGCNSSDGKNGAAGQPGAPGATGPTGPAGPPGPIAGTTEPRESCGVCHDDGSVYAITEAHAMPPVVAVSTPVFAQSGNDLVVTFNVKTDGVNFTAFPVGPVSTAYQFDGTLRNALNSVEASVPGDVATPVTLSGGTSGNYTITITNGFTQYGAVPSRYLFRLQRDALGDLPRIRAIVMNNYPSAPDQELVSTAGCSGCHSTMGNGFHYGYPVSGQNCTVCHDATNTNYPYLVNIGHGVHNSELMPAGSFDLKTKDASRTWTYAVTYPTYMTNCSVCHTKDSGALAKVNAMPVTADGCFTCHGSMDSWDFEPPAFSHAGVTGDCESCHFDGNALGAPTTVTQMHNGIETERVGLIWDGEDKSVTDGKDFTWQITGITDSVADGTLAITWTSTYKGASVDPCNSTIAANAPGFFNGPQPDGALSMLRSYQQGNDFVLGQSTSAPGQANSVNVTTANTTCAGNVATTTIPRDTNPDIVNGMVGIVALQGKPQILLPADFDAPQYSPEYEFDYEYVRVPTPTYEFVVGSGLPPTTMRREIVGNDQCLTCHVGSLYQHGNNRVDNTKMCVICHNSASSDQNNRVAMGVTASEAYDGKVGQTYELKTMLHRIHTSGESTTPFVIYRTRGIYAWAESVSDVPNWLPAVPCTPAQPGKSLVYGADPALAISCQPFSFYEPTYPRQFNDCAACHVPGSVDNTPEQSVAVATTLDTGAAPYGPGPAAQLNDTLQGASAAACTSCHYSTDVLGHAYQNGWVPQVFPEGRQTILDTP